MNYYNDIKKELINNENYKKVKDYSKNRNDLKTYYNVGKLIVDAQGGEERAKYGDGLIKQYSEKLTIELGKGYSARSLKYMRQFYLFQKWQPVVAQLSWSHYTILLPLKDKNKINYYISQCITYNLSKRVLMKKIKSNEYERLDEKTKEKLANNINVEAQDFIKNPILIKVFNDEEIINESRLKYYILENMEDFLHELGDGYSFIGSEYKIKIGNSYNYIDLLLFNYKYNSFVVVELKVTALKKDHVGQILTYMKYIDETEKSINHEKTMGIIICKENNVFIMKYYQNDNIYSTIYELV